MVHWCRFRSLLFLLSLVLHLFLWPPDALNRDLEKYLLRFYLK